MEEHVSAALDSRATVTGLALRPRATWSALQGAQGRRLWVPAVLIAGLTVLLVLVTAYADTHYRYGLDMDWFEQQSTGPAPELASVRFDAAALSALGALGALGLQWVVVTGALLLLGRLFGERRLSRADAVTLALWGWLPFIFRALLQLGFTAATGRPIYNLGLSGLVYDATPPPLTAIRYVTPSSARWATAALLRGVDLFAGWHVLLTGWGLAAFARIPPRKALALTAVVWLAALPLYLVTG